MTSHICLKYKHVYLYYALLLARTWKGKYKSPPEPPPFRSIRLLWHPASNDGACVTQHFPRTSNPRPLWPRGNPKETQIKPHSAFLVPEWGGGGSLSWLPTPLLDPSGRFSWWVRHRRDFGRLTADSSAAVPVCDAVSKVDNSHGRVFRLAHHLSTSACPVDTSADKERRCPRSLSTYFWILCRQWGDQMHIHTSSHIFQAWVPDSPHHVHTQTRVY